MKTIYVIIIIHDYTINNVKIIIISIDFHGFDGSLITYNDGGIIQLFTKSANYYIKGK